jgi:hypothetical protein
MPKGSIEWEYNPDEGLVLHVRPMFRQLFSDQARGHVRASRKEMLMALRSLIDAAVDKLEEKEKSTGKGRTKIKVE